MKLQLALFLLAASFCCIASASPVDFTFSATVTSGIGGGTAFSGSGAYDNSGEVRVGIEDLPLTAFTFSAFGSGASLPDFNAGAYAVVDNGTIIDFAAIFAKTPFYAFDFTSSGVFYDSLAGGHTILTVAGGGTYQITSTSSAAAPEPGDFFSCGIVLLAMAALMPRRNHLLLRVGNGVGVILGRRA